MSKGHKHAAMMMEYAKLAAEHERPWEFIEWLDKSGEWMSISCNPSWESHIEYRLKPRTIRIGEIDVPEPMRSAPVVGCYFVVDLSSSEMAFKYRWDGDFEDRRNLDRGMCHTTKEAALAHAKALILVSGGVV